MREQLLIGAGLPSACAPGNNPAEPGTYVISWGASDKNLGPTPISLYYSLTQAGPWSPIAKGSTSRNATGLVAASIHDWRAVLNWPT